MHFRECFTIDEFVRTGQKLGLKTIVRRMLLDFSFRVIVYYRLARWFKNIKLLNRVNGFLGQLILIRLARVPGVELFTQYEIGEGVYFAHPHDIVIGKGARIGRKVTIYNGVTLGAKTLLTHDSTKDASDRYPTIEDGVTVFPGAKLIGPITIGENSIIGANSVVMNSFPKDSIVAGSPAREIGRI